MREYQAYLLRLQRGENQTHWRVTLENAHTGELLRFANEREMLRYLIQILTTPSTDSGRPPAPNNSGKQDGL